MPLVYSIETGIPGTPGNPGGAGIADLILDPVQQLGYEQFPIWDGPTYLFTIHRLHFRGTYNPARFSWNIAQVSAFQDYTGLYPTMIPNDPRPPQPNLPPTTNNAIRHYLLHPRGQITYNIGGNPRVGLPGRILVDGGIEALRSPTNVLGVDQNGSPFQYQSDCKNGPVPLHCNVIEVKGTKTWLVDWAVECYVNESYIFRQSATLSALLSQRWTVEEDLDEDFFATRTIVGHAIFRRDRLQALDAGPDDFRGWLMHPVQDNFKRTVQQIVISEDGTRMDYVLVDKEQAVNLTPQVIGAGVTRIEAFYTQGYIRSKSVEDAIGAGTEHAMKAALDPLAAVMPVRTAAKLLMEEAEEFAAVMPRYHQVFVIRVWGKRTSTRYALHSVAMDIMQAKINGILPLSLGSGSIQTTENLLGKFIELKVDVTSGPIAGSIKMALNTILGQTIIGPDAINGITQDAPSPNSLPPLNNGTRSNMYAAVAQVLTGADDTSPQPNNNRMAKSLTPQGVPFG